MTSLLSSFLFFTVAFAAPSPALVSCANRRARLLSLLQEGTASLRRRLDEVHGTMALSEATRGEFSQKAEWLIAWWRDQEERLGGLSDCEGFPEIIADVQAQVTPVYLASLRAHAAVIIWEIDRVLQEVHAEASSPSDILQKLSEARDAFQEEQQAVSAPQEMRRGMRRALFLTQQALRLLRKRATLE